MMVYFRIRNIKYVTWWFWLKNIKSSLFWPKCCIRSHNTSSAKGLGVSVEGPRSLTHTLNASTKLPRKRRYLLRPFFWPIRRNPLLTQKPRRQTFPKEKPLAQRVMHSRFHPVLLRLSLERIPVKSIAIRVDKKDITLVIAPATSKENPFYPKTNHSDRY